MVESCVDSSAVAWRKAFLNASCAGEGACELAAFLAARIARYKMPKRFFFWDALPKSGYGKVPKRMVRDELEARGLLNSRVAGPP